jgi:predicted AlkP superfamily pyrophosphatase or phosphodiesterase
MLQTRAAFAALPGALLWALSLCSTAFAAPKVVLISIDGLRGPTLASLEQRHLQTPNLLEFVKGGAVADGLLGVFPTLTYPSHTTIVTGVAPDSHGIFGNAMFDPEHKFNGARNAYAQQIKHPTLWDAARKTRLTTAAVGWPVTVGAAIDANFPAYPIRTKEEVLLYRALCTPGLASEFEKSTGTTLTGNVNDDTRTAMAVFLISTRKPDLLLVHLGDVDHQSHAHGPDSPEAYQALEHIDRLIGRIREAVNTAEANDDVDFVVVSDHGFLPVSRTLQPDAVLGSLGLSAPKGHPEHLLKIYLRNVQGEALPIE